MSFVRVYIHMVFSTKKRIPYLSSSHIRYKLCKHIKENAKEKNIWLDCVNGYHDHIHCLVSIGATQTIGNIAQLIKGESSFWINKNKLISGNFSWQDDYWAAGLSDRHVKNVRKYIHNQEERHSKTSFSSEIDAFMKKNGFKIIKGY